MQSRPTFVDCNVSSVANVIWAKRSDVRGSG